MRRYTGDNLRQCLDDLNAQSGGSVSTVVNLTTSVETLESYAVNVKPGAFGNGIVDDTSAIQTAITSLRADHGGPSANGSGIVLFPPGRYGLTSPLTVPPGVTLRGAGGWDPDGGATTLAALGSFSGAALIQSSTWTTGDWAHATCVEDMHLDCNSVAAAGVAMHQMGEESLLSRVHVLDATDSGYLLTGEHAVGTIFDCSAWGCTNYGAKMYANTAVDTGNNGGNIRFFGFSGDSNGTHIYCNGSQRLWISGMKSELCHTVLEVAGSGTGGTAAVVTLQGTFNDPSGVNVVKISGTAIPSVTILPSQQATYTNWINDTVATKTVTPGLMARHPTLITWNGSQVHGGEIIYDSQQFLRWRDPYTPATVKNILSWSGNSTVDLNAGDANGVAIRDSSAALIATFTGTTLTLKDALNVVLGTGTGTKIGTATNQKLGFFNKTPVIQPSAYTVTNPTTDRGLNVTGDTLAQVAEVLGTLIADLQSLGLIG